ncbi:electron transfer flavoprotein beta subunit lysine methyltransferase [Spea bombifrons]|uniref:electron transfer flavoprotein beta subunit lysine methyltransferase n=1 Tax=Spea bombifrons TaxID=233779 RepID=UPI00234AFB69|nr:electron transfer flavoprotein beta subunit lysine methyltransferase [Spea bombifrons]
MLSLCRNLLRSVTGRPAPSAARMRSSATCLRDFILHNTEAVSEHLTPEIRLRLLTPRCRYWHVRPELWPYGEPYWAIYWPGGQALARYILDNPDIVRSRRVLDLGSGCGAAAIAAGMGGASYVLANDIDPVAGAAFSLNCELNHVTPLAFSGESIMEREAENWTLIVLGDMFYDEPLADLLHRWLRRCIDKHGTQVLIGDPGRPHFVGHPIQKQLRKLAQYDLPETARQENYGLTSTAVWRYEP